LGIANFGKTGVGVGIGCFTSDSATLLETIYVDEQSLLIRQCSSACLSKSVTLPVPDTLRAVLWYHFMLHDTTLHQTCFQ